MKVQFEMLFKSVLGVLTEQTKDTFVGGIHVLFVSPFWP